MTEFDEFWIQNEIWRTGKIVLNHFYTTTLNVDDAKFAIHNIAIGIFRKYNIEIGDIPGT